MADDTIFRLFSMTKPITSVALMTLYEQRLLPAQRPGASRDPGVARHAGLRLRRGREHGSCAKPKSPMTFRHVLSHQSGLSYGGGLVALVGLEGMKLHPVDQAYVDARRAARPARDAARRSSRSSRMCRCATTPASAGCTPTRPTSAATSSRQSPASRSTSTCRKSIFDPLGMKDTGFFVAAGERRASRCLLRPGARQVAAAAGRCPASDRLQKPTFFSGGGGLTGTTADYLRFCEMLRRGGELDGARILGPRTIDLMHAEPPDGRRRSLDDGDGRVLGDCV